MSLIYTTGELIDRISIEERKDIYGHGDKRLVNDLGKELGVRLGERTAAILILSVQLGIVNDAIANLEFQIRSGAELTDQEIGRRARAIRRLNDIRVSSKNSVSFLFGENAWPVYFGIGDLKAEDLTLDIQEPVRAT